MTSTWEEVRFYGQLAATLFQPSYDLRKVPGPRGHFAYGNITAVMRPDYHVQMLEWANQYGGVYKFSLGFQWVVVVSDPHVAVQVLGRGPESIPRKCVGYKFFDLATNAAGAHSFFTTSDEAQWSAVRKAAAVAFSSANVRKAFPIALRHSLLVADALNPTSPPDHNNPYAQLLHHHHHSQPNGHTTPATQDNLPRPAPPPSPSPSQQTTPQQSQQKQQPGRTKTTTSASAVNCQGQPKTTTDPSASPTSRPTTSAHAADDGGDGGPGEGAGPRPLGYVMGILNWLRGRVAAPRPSEAAAPSGSANTGSNTPGTAAANTATKDPKKEERQEKRQQLGDANEGVLRSEGRRPGLPSPSPCPSPSPSVEAEADTDAAYSPASDVSSETYEPILSIASPCIPRSHPTATTTSTATGMLGDVDSPPPPESPSSPTSFPVCACGGTCARNAAARADSSMGPCNGNGNGNGDNGFLVVDIQEYLELSLLHVFVEALFDIPFQDFSGRQVAADMNLVLEEANERLKVPLRKVAMALVQPKAQAAVRAAQLRLAAVYSKMYDAIRSRGTPPDSVTDLWACLARVRHPTSGQLLSREALVPELGALTMAGFDTSSHSVAWVLFALAVHPEVQRRVQQELAGRGLMGAGSSAPRPPTLDDLSQLPYLNAVIDETMRMYPVAATASVREVTRPTRVGDYVIPPGVIVWPMLYAIHNSTHNWDQPEVFKPERWMEGAGAPTPTPTTPNPSTPTTPNPNPTTPNPSTTTTPNPTGTPNESAGGAARERAPAGPTDVGAAAAAAAAQGCGEEGGAVPTSQQSGGGGGGGAGGAEGGKRFMPFSDGMKSCLGQAMGLMEVRTMLVVLLSRYNFDLEPELGGEEGVRRNMVMSLTLKIKGGLKLRVSPLGK